MMEVFQVKDPEFRTQKDNRNPDGSDNMTWSKEFGRFNQCMIASNTAVLVQNFKTLRRLGVKQFLSGDFDELAYAIAFSEFAKGNGSTFKDDRFFWAKHADFMTRAIQDNFGETFFYEFNTFNGSFDKMKLCLSGGFQFSIGFKMESVVPGIQGHVVSCSGLYFQGDKLVKGEFQDPAGDANNPITYRGMDLELGQNVTYNKEFLSKVLFPRVNSYLVLKVKK